MRNNDEDYLTIRLVLMFFGLRLQLSIIENNVAVGPYQVVSGAESVEKDGKLCITVRFKLVGDNIFAGYEESLNKEAVFQGRSLRKKCPNLSPCRRYTCTQ